MKHGREIEKPGAVGFLLTPHTTDMKLKKAARETPSVDRKHLLKSVLPGPETLAKAAWEIGHLVDSLSSAPPNSTKGRMLPFPHHISKG